LVDAKNASSFNPVVADVFEPARVHPANLGKFLDSPAYEPRCALSLPDGGLAVTDPCRHNIKLFSPCALAPSTATHRIIGRYGTAIGEFISPAGLATDGAHLFVLDSGNCLVQQLRLSENVVVDAIGEQGSGDGQLGRPWCLALVAGGGGASGSRNEDRLFVADSPQSTHLRLWRLAAALPLLLGQRWPRHVHAAHQPGGARWLPIRGRL